MTLGIGHAMAAGLVDCGLAATADDRTVCADDGLRTQDEEAARLYSRLRQKGKLQADSPLELQGLLSKRDVCDGDRACLTTAYRRLITAVRERLAYVPDVEDWRAIAELRDAVSARRRLSSEWALEDVLRRYEAQVPSTAFDGVGEGSDAGLPKDEPSGLMDDEWRALNEAHFHSEGEYVMRYFFRLLDLDGDGVRDLVLNTVTDGRQSDAATRVFRRVGEHFAGFGSYRGDGSQREIYFPPYPGSDSIPRWVKVRGRVYAAYVERDYGSDTLRLLRPFEINLRSLGFAVRYRYRLTLPHHQQPADGAAFDIPQREWLELDAVLRRVSHGPARPEQGVDRQVCPTVSGAEADDDGRFGPGADTYESIADFAVHLHNQCIPARLLDSFGWYEKGYGLRAGIEVRATAGSPPIEYQVRGVRWIVGVSRPSLSTDQWIEDERQ